jgi:hypothetical protein
MCLLAMAAPGLVTASESIVRQFVDAYNNQDLEAMLSLCDDGVRWLAIDGEAVEVITNDKDELRSALQADFAARRFVFSELVGLTADGGMVIAIEKASRRDREDSVPKCSVSVYKTVAGRITEVWYFPAWICDTSEPRDE